MTILQVGATQVILICGELTLKINHHKLHVLSTVKGDRVLVWFIWTQVPYLSSMPILYCHLVANPMLLDSPKRSHCHTQECYRYDQMRGLE